MYKKITSENVTMFAIRNYDNPHCQGEKEFYDDMKYKETNVLKERLILNHIIILRNLFGPEACVTLLLFKIQQEYFGTLKSFLLYLNMIREDELRSIKEDKYTLDTLRKL